MPARDRRRYTEEFKGETVWLVCDSVHLVAQVARDLRIQDNVLYRWTAQHRQAEAHGITRAVQCAEADELARVKRELVRVTQERDFLRCAAGALREGISMRYRALTVSPAGYYAWAGRGHHRYLDHRGLGISRGGARPLLARRDRLGAGSPSHR